jgi:hypothetical protein
VRERAPSRQELTHPGEIEGPDEEITGSAAVERGACARGSR